MRSRNDRICRDSLALMGIFTTTFLSVPAFGEGATRDLPDSYQAGVTFTVTILIAPPDGSFAVGLEDMVPDGWSVANPSDGGTWIQANNTVRWGPFFEPFPIAVSYEVAPPAGTTGERCFSGSISFDGLPEPVVGGECLSASCGCDFDDDGNVDLDDYVAFWDCKEQGDRFRAPGSRFSGGSECTDVFDSNGDGVIDLIDWSRFQIAFTGSD